MSTAGEAPSREEAERAMRALDVYRDATEFADRLYALRAEAIVVASYHFTPTEIARRLGVGRKIVYDALQSRHRPRKGGTPDAR